jgi:RNA recognition motif-containing protein
MTTLHVANLAWEASADDLFRLFQAYGRVLHAQVIMDHDRGRSRGFGFVDMADDAEARQAAAALDGQIHVGRRLQVAEARRAGPSPER